MVYIRKKNMKKLFTTISLIVFVLGFSQDKAISDFPKNEIKGNVIYLLAGAIEVTYEHLLNDESGLGVSLFVPISNDFDTKFSLSPYYRFYFGKKPAAGFFVEGFGMLNSYTQHTSDGGYWSSNYFGPEKDITDFALGIGLGGKWVTKRGVLFELSGGLGRNLFNSSDTDHQMVWRGGLTIGYRFK